jgi:hypothetical protein
VEHRGHEILAMADRRKRDASDVQRGEREQELRETQGRSIRRIKVDGGCYEVYAVNDKGQRVETYFHPVTFEHVLTTGGDA